MYRKIAGQDTKALTIRLRYSVYEKLQSLAGGQPLVITIEQMTEYLHYRRAEKAKKKEQHLSSDSSCE